jgi:hypothetical protein
MRIWGCVVLIAAALAAGLAARAVAAVPIDLALRGSIALPASAADQHSTSFTVTGLSGITHLGGTRFAAVMDNSNKLVTFDLALAADGTPLAATHFAGRTLDETRDFEGIAYTGARRGTVWLADEGGPQLREYELKSGAFVRSLAAPAAFANRRGGFGFESLTRRADGQQLWTANEEALTVDGPFTSATQGGVVRLLRYAAEGDSFAAAEQYAYPVEPWHGGDSASSSAERSGLVDLVSLADGRLLALERSLAFTGPIPSFQSRIYELDLSAATNVAPLSALAGATYTPVAKRLVWSGLAAGVLGMNLEGLAVGPRLASGHETLVGIVDDGGTADPLSSNTLVVFEVTTPIAGPTQGDANFDGVVDLADVVVLARGFGVAEDALWSDADFDGDGRVALSDIATVSANWTQIDTPAEVRAPANAADFEPLERGETVTAPEPSGVWLLLAAVGTLAVARVIWRCTRRGVS